MVWWNKSKKIEKAIPHQPQGLKASLDELARKDKAEAEHSRQIREQERCEKTEHDQQEAMALLKSQLAYCFGISVSPQQNPVQVEGMWFGIGRYNADSEEYGAWGWLFSLLVL